MALQSPSKRRPGKGRTTNPGSQALLLYCDSERDANMLYATGVFVPDPFLYFRARGKSIVVVSDMEYQRVKREARADETLSYGQVFARSGGRDKTARTVPAICLWVIRSKKIGSVVVPSTFPLGLADDLRRDGLMVRPREDPFFPERSIKNEGEVRKIRSSLGAAEAGMREALNALRESRVEKKAGGKLRLGVEYLTSERLRSLIQKTILAKQCHAMHTIVAGGRQGYDPHETGKGPLRANQPIIVDIFPRSEVTGYYGDMTRTFLKGRADPRVRSMYLAVKKAQDYVLSNVAPGVQAQKIHQGVVELFSKRGFPTVERNQRMEGFIHGTGHGLGLEIHEHPRISTSSCKLKKGHVVTVEPGLYYPDVGGVRLEDVIWITDKGAKKLTRFPRFLEI